MNRTLSGIVRFGCVGGLAMLVHFLVVALLVPFGVAPLIANIAAFIVAFQISFLGHRQWTFAAKKTAGQYPKMFVVSLTGFAVNEMLYAFLLKSTQLDYRTALLIVLLAVASGTYLGSRFWVFKPIKIRP
mgnify:CR=1 FL=1